MSCCKNNGTFLTRSFDNDCCERRNCCDCRTCSCNKCKCNGNNFNNNFDNDFDECDTGGRAGISCPNINDNDCNCVESLREVACRLTNQRVIIYTRSCKMCVVIVSIGKYFIKTVNPCTHKIVYFNLNRINNIEDVLPRCYN